MSIPLRYRVTIMLLALSSLWGCATHSGAPASKPDHPHTDFRMLSDIAYTPKDWPQTLYADLYLPRTTPRRADGNALASQAQSRIQAGPLGHQCLRLLIRCSPGVTDGAGRQFRQPAERPLWR